MITDRVELKKLLLWKSRTYINIERRGKRREIIMRGKEEKIGEEKRKKGEKKWENREKGGKKKRSQREKRAKDKRRGRNGENKAS